MLKKINRVLYLGTYWLPRVVWLHVLWLLGALPLVTLARSTRVMVGLIERYMWQEFETGSVWQDFWRAYRKNAFAVKRMDGVFSGYFVIALFNLFWLKEANGIVAQSLWSFCFFLLFVGSALFLVQAFLANYRQQEVSFLAAFVFAGRHSKQLLLHGLFTVSIILILGFVGPFFLLVGGLALLVSLNLAIIHSQQKKTAHVLEREMQGE